MRKFRFIGTGTEAREYDFPQPIVGQVYDYNEAISGESAGYYAKHIGWEWEEVINDYDLYPEGAGLKVTQFEMDVEAILIGIQKMLVEKNKKYGNSALHPVRIFSKACTVEQLKVRIDDKLSRIANSPDDEDEDVINDLIGYLVILKMGTKNG